MDTWQVTNKLTLNLGVRWEQPGSYSEVNNNDTVLLTNLATSLPSFTNPVTGATSPTVGGLALVASPQYGSRREEALHWKLFSPREGFDYRIDNKTVVRGGYGIAFLPPRSPRTALAAAPSTPPAQTSATPPASPTPASPPLPPASKRHQPAPRAQPDRAHPAPRPGHRIAHSQPALWLCAAVQLRL